MKYIPKIILGIYLFYASLTDIKEKKLSITYLVAGFAIIPFFLFFDEIELIERLTGVIPGILLWTASVISKGVGKADVVVVILIGLCIRIGGIILVLSVSFILIAIFSGFMLLFGKLKLKSRIPYIPFAFAGYLVSCIF